MRTQPLIWCLVSMASLACSTGTATLDAANQTSDGPPADVAPDPDGRGDMGGDAGGDDGADGDDGSDGSDGQDGQDGGSGSAGDGGDGGGGADGGPGGDGPEDCEEDGDCADTCPPGSVGCVCFDQVCSPSCTTDEDCPAIPEVDLECDTANGVCLPVQGAGG